MDPKQRIIITGGPGAGKTTLLDTLHSIGFNIVSESAREIIQDRRNRGLCSRPSPIQFAEQVLDLDIEKYNQPSLGLGLIFFDRGIPDALCMLDQVSALEQSKLEVFQMKYPYNSQVFILPPWRDIYTNDSERDQTFDEAIHVYELLRKWYHRCRYTVVEIPKFTIAERCDFVLQKLNA